MIGSLNNALTLTLSQREMEPAQDRIPISEIPDSYESQFRKRYCLSLIRSAHKGRPYNHDGAAM